MTIRGSACHDTGMNLTPSREKLFIAIALILPVVLVVGLLEIVLRILPVGTGLSTQAVTQDQPIARFTPNQNFTWSDEWNFEIVNQGRVNNDGFVNDQDYTPADPRPLMAVIGDSYIESLMVPYAQTLQGRLATNSEDRARVYSFAASGAPLSQYLIWARYARDTYRPQALTVLIVGNDFDESLPAYDLKQVFHQFAPDEQGHMVPRLLQEYHPNWKRDIIKRSALARYVFFNLSAWQTWAKIKQFLMRRDMPETIYAGNTSADTDSQRMADSKMAVDLFLAQLPQNSGLKPKDIILIMDASRGDIYIGKPESERGYYFDVMRRYVITQARQKGYQVIDMEPVMAAHYKKNQQKFEFPSDAHWNGLAHELAAKEVQKTSIFQKLIH